MKGIKVEIINVPIALYIEFDFIHLSDLVIDMFSKRMALVEILFFFGLCLYAITYKANAHLCSKM